MVSRLLQGSPKSPTSGEGGAPASDSAAGAVSGSGPEVPAMPEAPALASDFADKLPSSAAEMSAVGHDTAEIPGVSMPEASAAAFSGDVEMPGPLPAAGDILVGESRRRFAALLAQLIEKVLQSIFFQASSS